MNISALLYPSLSFSSQSLLVVHNLCPSLQLSQSANNSYSISLIPLLVSLFSSFELLFYLLPACKFKVSQGKQI